MKRAKKSAKLRPLSPKQRELLARAMLGEDRLWQSLADHIAIDSKARAETKDPSLRVVN